ncbi:DUF523 domain-containing protein, partial [bacterium]|nr:DUF523 domain-containing protein [bacterium]
SCLLGNNVRYDGELKQDLYTSYILSKIYDLIPVCPEVEAGFPTPRDAIWLTDNPENPVLIVEKTGKDITEQMISWSKKRCDELKQDSLCGFIFKSKSPSCGLHQVQLINKDNIIEPTGTGIFARIFRQQFPKVPVIDEIQLTDSSKRENFINSVNKYHHDCSRCDA